MPYRHEPLVFHWEEPSQLGSVAVDDETLRDGLQDPTITQPPCAAKKDYLHLIADLGVNAVDLGMPAASRQAAEDVEVLLREIQDASLPLAANCAVRMLEHDVLASAELGQRVGAPLEVMLFLGFSAIRRQAEGWQRDVLLHKLEAVVAAAVREGLAATYVVEDATRTSPEELKTVILCAVRAGASRVCLADTTGAVSPSGAQRLVTFSRKLLEDHGFGLVKVDWHGHNDRGLAVACALAAAYAGAERLHGTLLGVGERAGNAPLEQLILNLQVAGAAGVSSEKLVPKLRQAAETLGLSVPAKTPVLGEAVFSTATGVHASAILKARKKGQQDVEELVYNFCPPSAIGACQRVLVGPFSGAANVRFWLLEHGFPENDQLVQGILRAAKKSSRVLSDEEIYDLFQRLS